MLFVRVRVRVSSRRDGAWELREGATPAPHSSEQPLTVIPGRPEADGETMVFEREGVAVTEARECEREEVRLMEIRDCEGMFRSFEEPIDSEMFVVVEKIDSRMLFVVAREVFDSEVAKVDFQKQVMMCKAAAEDRITLEIGDYLYFD